jgi:hypothetical protein
VSATYQCRVIPGESLDGITEQLAAHDPGSLARITVRTPGAPGPESPPTPAIVGKVEKLTKAMWPDVIVLPYMSAGATDSKYLRAAASPPTAWTPCSTTSTTAARMGATSASASRMFAQEVEIHRAADAGVLRSRMCRCGNASSNGACRGGTFRDEWLDYSGGGVQTGGGLQFLYAAGSPGRTAWDVA